LNTSTIGNEVNAKIESDSDSDLPDLSLDVFKNFRASTSKAKVADDLELVSKTSHTIEKMLDASERY